MKKHTKNKGALQLILMFLGVLASLMLSLMLLATYPNMFTLALVFVSFFILIYSVPITVGLISHNYIKNNGINKSKNLK